MRRLQARLSRVQLDRMRGREFRGREPECQTCGDRGWVVRTKRSERFGYETAVTTTCHCRDLAIKKAATEAAVEVRNPWKTDDD